MVMFTNFVIVRSGTMFRWMSLDGKQLSHEFQNYLHCVNHGNKNCK